MAMEKSEIEYEKFKSVQNKLLKEASLKEIEQDINNLKKSKKS